MKKREKSTTWLYTGVVCLVLSIVFIFAVTAVDVQEIGPNGTSVGFAGINGAIAKAIGSNMVWYKITQLLGYLALVIFAFYVICGLVQLIKRKSLFKVDQDLLVMGYMFIILFLLYIAFDKVAINYRPMLLPGETSLEPSFPSSHTMLALCVFGTSWLFFKRRLGQGKAYSIIRVMMLVLMVVTVLGRLLSGAHWFTDIIGGLLISLTLVSFYAAFSQK